jgi:hypothetical protein
VNPRSHPAVVPIREGQQGSDSDVTVKAELKTPSIGSLGTQSHEFGQVLRGKLSANSSAVRNTDELSESLSH